MSVSRKHIHTQTHTGHPPLQAAGCRSISYYRNIYAQLQSAGVSCQSAWCQRGDPLVWVTAGGQDMTYRYAPAETAGSTAWLLSKLHSSSCCSFLLSPSVFLHRSHRFPSFNSRSVWWLNFKSLEEVMTKTNAVSPLLVPTFVLMEILYLMRDKCFFFSKWSTIVYSSAIGVPIFHQKNVQRSFLSSPKPYLWSSSEAAGTTSTNQRRVPERHHPGNIKSSLHSLLLIKPNCCNDWKWAYQGFYQHLPARSTKNIDRYFINTKCLK